MSLRLIWPTCITFLDLRLEFQKLVRKIAEQVDEELSETHTDSFDLPPRFCVGVDIRKGWVSNVVRYSAASGSSVIVVHYNVLNLNCVLCGLHLHHTRTCQDQSNGILQQRLEPRINNSQQISPLRQSRSTYSHSEVQPTPSYPTNEEHSM